MIKGIMSIFVAAGLVIFIAYYFGGKQTKTENSIQLRLNLSNGENLPVSIKKDDLSRLLYWQQYNVGITNLEILIRKEP